MAIEIRPHQIWHEVHKVWDRYVRIEPPQPGSRIGIPIRSVSKTKEGWVVSPRARLSYANERRFNGKPGGYELVEDAPLNADNPPPSYASGSLSESEKDTTADGRIRILQIWQEVDPRFERKVRVEKILEDGRIGILTVERSENGWRPMDGSRIRYADPNRFNGKRGNYKLVEEAPGVSPHHAEECSQDASLQPGL